MHKGVQRLAVGLAIVMIIIAFFAQQAIAHEGNHDCEKHPIYCQIINNTPNIKRAYAFELSNVIYKITSKYSLDSELFTAILAQESKYDMSTKRCRSGLVEVASKDEFGIVDFDATPKFVVEKICTDFGIGQVWYKTADSYDFDIHKLTNDLEYSVEAAAIILKDFQNRYSKKEVSWWTRYNASTPSKREVYKKLVDKYKNAK